MRVHPAARRPYLALAVALLLGLLSGGLFWLLPPLTALLLSLMLWGSLASFFLPTSYVVEEERLLIRRGFWQEAYPWSRFRRLVRDRNGLLLSPFTRPHGLESFRGLFLPMDPQTAAALAPLLEARL